MTKPYFAYHQNRTLSARCFYPPLKAGVLSLSIPLGLEGGSIPTLVLIFFGVLSMRKYLAYFLAIFLIFTVPAFAFAENIEHEDEHEEAKRVIPDPIEEPEQIEPEYYDIYFYQEEELSYMLETIANLVNRNNYLLEISNKNNDIANIRLYNQIVYTLYQLEELEKQQQQLADMYELLYQEMVERKEVTETEIETAHGFLTIQHKLTLGDMIVFIVLGLLIITIVFKWFISKIWG